METILEYKYQVALEEKRRDHEESQAFIAERKRDYETLCQEIPKALRDESAFSITALQAMLQETEIQLKARTEYLYELEAKLHNAEQLRREIEIKQLKYCGLKQIFETGTMEEKKMLLSIMIQRVEIRQGYELNIQLTPGFDQFLEGLIELR